ncbi:unnamed protein product, partial [Polarella glacialis]
FLRQFWPSSSNGLRALRHLLYSMMMTQLVIVVILVSQFASDMERRDRCSTALLLWGSTALVFVLHGWLHHLSGPFFARVGDALTAREGPAGGSGQLVGLCGPCSALLQQLLAALSVVVLFCIGLRVADRAGFNFQALVVAKTAQQAEGSERAPASLRGSTQSFESESPSKGGGQVQAEQVASLSDAALLSAMIISVCGVLACGLWAVGLAKQLQKQELTASRAERRALRLSISGAVLSFTEILEARRPSQQDAARSSPAVLEQQEVVQYAPEVLGDAECSICAE